ncbi:hypothetical protein [Streptomyces sp. NPDC055085]
MGISYVGELGTDNNNGTSSAWTVTPTANATSGNTVFVIGRFPADTAGQTLAVTDSLGNTWTTDYVFSQTVNYLFIASTRQDAGVLSTSSTITLTASGARRTNCPTFTWVEEFTGILAAGYTNGTAGTVFGPTATTGTTATKTPSVNNDLVLALVDIQSSSTTATENGSGTVGTYSTPTTAQITSVGAGTARRDRVAFQALSGGSGVGQTHTWSFSGSVWSDKLSGLYKPAEANASAGSPTGAATANSATGGVGASAGAVTAAATAYDATVSILEVGSPTGVATANSATVQAAASAAGVAGAATAFDVALGYGGVAGAVTAVATAFDASVATSASAGVAQAAVSVSGATVDTPPVTPDSRVIVVEAESRTFVVPAEDRTRVIDAEIRSFTVDP